MPMKQEGSRSNSATSNRPSKWSNATHNNNRGCRRSSSRRARIRRLSRRRKSLNSPLAAGRWSSLKKSRLEAGATKRARRVVPLHGREHRAELACGEIFHGAQASVEFGGRQAPQAVEGAQKIPGRAVALACVAFDAAGNQVAVGIASEARARHDVIEALHVGGSAAKAVKASAAFAIVNGFAERPSFQEIGGLEGRGRRLFRGLGGAIFVRADGADLLGQAHLHEVAGFAAFKQAQSPQLIEPAHRLAHRSVGQTEIASDGQNRKMQAELAYDEGMAQEIGVDGAVPDGQAETRGENIFKLHPEEFGVQFFWFHDLIQRWNGDAAETLANSWRL